MDLSFDSTSSAQIASWVLHSTIKTKNLILQLAAEFYLPLQQCEIPDLDQKILQRPRREHFANRSIFALQGHTGTETTCSADQHRIMHSRQAKFR